MPAVLMTEINGDPILAEGTARIDKVISEGALSAEKFLRGRNRFQGAPAQAGAKNFECHRDFSLLQRFVATPLRMVVANDS